MITSPNKAIPIRHQRCMNAFRSASSRSSPNLLMRHDKREYGRPNDQPNDRRLPPRRPIPFRPLIPAQSLCLCASVAIDPPIPNSPAPTATKPARKKAPAPRQGSHFHSLHPTNFTLTPATPPEATPASPASCPTPACWASHPAASGPAAFPPHWAGSASRRASGDALHRRSTFHA